MMKLLKKCFIFVICAIMSLTLFSFTACDNGVTDKVIAAVAEQKIAAMGFNASVETQASGNGVTQKEISGVKVLVNFESLDADFLSFETKEGQVHSSRYNYEFLRSGNLFSYKNGWEIKNWTGEKLTHGGTREFEQAFKEIKEIISELQQLNPQAWEELEKELPALLQEAVAENLQETVAFAQFLDVVSAEDTVITVDLNKAVYQLITDFKKIVNSLKDDTTVLDILKNKTIEKYMNFFLRDVTAESVRDGLKQAVDFIGENADLSESARSALTALTGIEPAKNATAYKYILQILSADSFNALLQESGVDFSMNTKFSTINEQLKQVFGDDWRKDFNESMKNITKKEMQFDVETLQASVRNLKIEFVLNDGYTVQSAALSGTVTMTDGAEISVTTTLSGTAKFYDSAQTLTNIGGAIVQKALPPRADGVSDKMMYASLDLSWDVMKRYGLYPIFKDEELVGFKAYGLDDGGKELPSSYDKETKILSFDSALIENEAESRPVRIEMRITEYTTDFGMDVISANATKNARGFADVDLTPTLVPVTVTEYINS